MTKNVTDEKTRGWPAKHEWPAKYEWPGPSVKSSCPKL